MSNTAQGAAQRRETIRGTIVPEQWDDEYRVTGVLLACDNEREVHIGNSHLFPGLLSGPRSEVLLTGTVCRQGTAETMQVESFKFLDNNQPY